MAVINVCPYEKMNTKQRIGLKPYRYKNIKIGLEKAITNYTFYDVLKYVKTGLRTHTRTGTQT